MNIDAELVRGLDACLLTGKEMASDRSRLEGPFPPAPAELAAAAG